MDPVLFYISIFFGGWVAGAFLEYLLHWIMHRWTLGFHIGHHKEFFFLDGRQVAKNTIDPRLDIYFFIGILVVASPLMLLWGWAPVLVFWGAMFWHVVIFYEICHALIHYDRFLPTFISQSRPFVWWKGCHFEHHFHSPLGNYCVTFPFIDLFFGTYVKPRDNYPELPHPKIKPQQDQHHISSEVSDDK